MGAESPFTRDDLDELSDTAYDSVDPTEVAATLVAIASDGRLADRADACHALQLAAELYERAEDLPRALAVAEQALAAHRDLGGRGAAPVRAYRAGLLLRVGQESEAVAELAQLRPLMVTDPLAAAYVPEALAGGGRGEVARQWLDRALADIASDDADHPVVAQLLATRDALPDAAEDDATSGATSGAASGAEEVADPAGYPAAGAGSGEAVLLFWPEAEYELVDERWPEVLEVTGADDWDDYRRRQQLLIADWARRRGSLWLVTGTADGFTEFLEEQGADLASDDLVNAACRYGDHLFELDPVPLPPAPSDACWCGSGTAYQRCCQTRWPSRR